MLELDKKTGLFYRPEYKELYVIREQSQYKTLDFKNKVVMDIGANIGAVSDLAIKSGAKKAYSYEPMPHTFEVLRKNLNGKCELYNRAITSTNVESVDFYIHKKYPSCNSIIEGKNKEKIKVLNIKLEDEIERIKPEVLKIDIEGGEYDILNNFNIPNYLEQIAVEFHHISKKEYKDQALEIIKKFNDWHVHKKFRFNWYVTQMVLHRDKVGNIGSVKNYLESGIKGL